MALVHIPELDPYGTIRFRPSSYPILDFPPECFHPARESTPALEKDGYKYVLLVTLEPVAKYSIDDALENSLPFPVQLEADRPYPLGRCHL